MNTLKLEKNNLTSFKNLEINLSELHKIYLSTSLLGREELDNLCNSFKPRVETIRFASNLIYLKSYFIQANDHKVDCLTTLNCLKNNVIFNLNDESQLDSFLSGCSELSYLFD